MIVPGRSLNPSVKPKEMGRSASCSPFRVPSTMRSEEKEDMSNPAISYL